MNTASKDCRVPVAVLLGLMLVLLFFWPRATPRPVSIDMTGTPGLRVRGDWTVDGVRHPFHAVLPTNFVMTTRQLSFELVKEGTPGTFKIQLVPKPTEMGPMSSESDYGIRGEVAFDGTHEQRILHAFAR